MGSMAKAMGGGPGRTGAGINNGSGTATRVTGAVDVGSYGSFMADIGAAASGVWSDLISIGSRVDKSNSPALYVGDTNNAFSNVYLIESDGIGVWSDVYATGAIFANVNVKAPRGPCLYLKGQSVWANVICSDPYFRAVKSGAAIIVDVTSASINGLSIQGLSLTAALSKPSQIVEVLGRNAVTGRIEGVWPPDVALRVDQTPSASALRIGPP